MGFLTKLFASAVVRKVLMWSVLGVAGYLLGGKIISGVADVIDRAERYEQMQLEALEANRKLVEERKRADAELARMQADRDALTNNVLALKERARLEQQEYERLLQTKPENKAWADSALPGDIKRLRDTRFNPH